MDDEIYPIGAMCAEFGVTPRTLRFYEAKELIAPRREGQRRLYTRRCRARLKLILQGKRFGFSLEDIRQLLDLYDIGDRQVTQVARTHALGRAAAARHGGPARRARPSRSPTSRASSQRAEAYLARHGAGAAAE